MVLFLHRTATLFFDVDISTFCNTENLNELIYGYGKPVYISFTHKPLGILIVIYEDGVTVDLEIIEKIDIQTVNSSILMILSYTITVEIKNYVKSLL